MDPIVIDPVLHGWQEAQELQTAHSTSAKMCWALKIQCFTSPTVCPIIEPGKIFILFARPAMSIVARQERVAHVQQTANQRKAQKDLAMTVLGRLTWVAILTKCRAANSPVATMRPRPKEERGWHRERRVRIMYRSATSTVSATIMTTKKALTAAPSNSHHLRDYSVDKCAAGHPGSHSRCNSYDAYIYALCML